MDLFRDRHLNVSRNSVRLGNHEAPRVRRPQNHDQIRPSPKRGRAIIFESEPRSDLRCFSVAEACATDFRHQTISFREARDSSLFSSVVLPAAPALHPTDTGERTIPKTTKVAVEKSIATKQNTTAHFSFSSAFLHEVMTACKSSLNSSCSAGTSVLPDAIPEINPANFSTRRSSRSDNAASRVSCRHSASSPGCRAINGEDSDAQQRVSAANNIWSARESSCFSASASTSECGATSSSNVIVRVWCLVIFEIMGIGCRKQKSLCLPRSATTCRRILSARLRCKGNVSVTKRAIRPVAPEAKWHLLQSLGPHQNECPNIMLLVDSLAKPGIY